VKRRKSREKLLKKKKKSALLNRKCSMDIKNSVLFLIWARSASRMRYNTRVRRIRMSKFSLNKCRMIMLKRRIRKWSSPWRFSNTWKTSRLLITTLAKIILLIKTKRKKPRNRGSKSKMMNRNLPLILNPILKD
jgi:hypothetical protein